MSFFWPFCGSDVFRLVESLRQSRCLRAETFETLQRSRQPWILLFSLETLICNRSPLPLRLSNLRNYLILLATLDLGTFLLLSH